MMTARKPIARNKTKQMVVMPPPQKQRQPQQIRGQEANKVVTTQNLLAKKRKKDAFLRSKQAVDTGDTANPMRSNHKPPSSRETTSEELVQYESDEIANY